MGARGRRSAESQQTVVVGSFGQQRPPPPADLSFAQAEIWKATVASEAPTFFATAASQALLVNYCRHSTTAAVLSIAIGASPVELDKAGLKRMDKLLGMRERETRAAAAHATRLRITNQSRYGPKAAATAGRHSASTRPWEIG